MTSTTGDEASMPTSRVNRFCGGCGTPLKPESRFCPTCGRKLADPDIRILADTESGLPRLPDRLDHADRTDTGVSVSSPVAIASDEGESSSGAAPRQPHRGRMAIAIFGVVLILAVAGGITYKLTRSTHGSSSIPSATKSSGASSAPPTSGSSSGTSSQFGQIQGVSGEPAGIVTTLTTYFNAIDTGDYPTAYAQLAPSEQTTTSESQFAAGHATSFDYDVTLGTATATSTGSYLVDVSFTSRQSPAEGPGGDQCDNWTLQYTMASSGGSWLIESTGGQGGVTHSTC